MKKFSVMFKQKSGWKSYNLVCTKSGEKSGNIILHPVNSENFNSLQINYENNRVVALTDEGQKEYNLNYVKDWESEHEIHIFGSSDDLIEIRGDTKKEFYANYDEPTYININDKTVVRAKYDRSGQWMVKMVKNGNCENYTHYDIDSETSNSYKSHSELLCVGFDNPIDSIEKADK